MIHRYSSRRSPLKDFLATQLQGARRYDRIAGFFSSSILEVAGEALERMTPEGGETQGAVLSSKIEGTQAILGELLKFEAGEADNGIKSMTGPRLREAVIQAPV
jgi:hypothetical protein